jgi:hypothetical protein
MRQTFQSIRLFVPAGFQIDYDRHAYLSDGLPRPP